MFAELGSAYDAAMPLRQTLELPQASIEIEERPGYLFVVEKGQLRDLGEVRRYTLEMETIIAATGIDRAIIDARGEIGSPPQDVRDAMWDWLSAPQRGFALIAFVLPSEMAVARVNMTALSRRAPVRAFESVQTAQRWLMRGPRASSIAGFAVPGSSPPEPKETSVAFAKTERPPPPPSAPPATRPGFRPPTPGPSESLEVPTRTAAPTERSSRTSDVHRRGFTPVPKKDREGGGTA